VERGAILVISIAHAQVAGMPRRRDTRHGLRTQSFRCARNGTAFPLLKPVINAKGVIGIGQRSAYGFDVNEPGALEEVDEQEHPRDELRRADRAGSEKSAYQGQTECFTMSETMMDSNPPPSAPEPVESSSPDPSSTHPFAPAFAHARRESAFSPLLEIFEGPEGLYPGARWLIYIGMGFVTLALLNSILYSLRGDSDSLWWSMAGEVRMMLAAILPAFIMARVEGRSFGDFGLPAKGALGRYFWTGALWGIGSLTALMLALRVTGVFSFGSLQLHGMRILKLGLFYAAFFLVAALFEDFLLRGYSQWVLAKGMYFWPAAATLSILFGVIHGANPGEEKIGLVAVVAIGFFFCLTLRRTGNLWWAIGFHMAWDWGESYLYSVPDSGNVVRGRLLNSSLQGPVWLTGGSVGPEGSYLVFVVIAAVWVLFSHVYPEVKYGGQDAGL